MPIIDVPPHDSGWPEAIVIYLLIVFALFLFTSTGGVSGSTHDRYRNKRRVR